MSIDAIKKARNSGARDTFPEGTVIRWTASGRYTYAALKTPAGWFTTARYGNSFCPQNPDWSELLEILARSETTDVAVSESWRVIDDAQEG